LSWLLLLLLLLLLKPVDKQQISSASQHKEQVAAVRPTDSELKAASLLPHTE